MGPIGCHETSVINYNYSLCKRPVAQKSTILIYIMAEDLNHTKSESNWKQLCRVHKQVSRLSWVSLSATGATGYMPGLYCTVYTARMVPVYSEVQMFADLVQCVILHTPYKHEILLPLANVWCHIPMPSCLHPHIAPVLTYCVTGILCTWRVSKRCDLIFLCLHSLIYSMLIAHSYHNTNQ